MMNTDHVHVFKRQFQVHIMQLTIKTLSGCFQHFADSININCAAKKNTSILAREEEKVNHCHRYPFSVFSKNAFYI